MKSYAIVLGGGSGKRMAAGCNKVFLPLRGVPAIARAIAPFSGLCAGCVVVAASEELAQMREVLKRCSLERFVISVVPGGKERQDSVWNGLRALPQDADCVLIHDGARALVTEDVIQRAIASVGQRGSGVAAVPVVDTIKRADGDGRALETLDRSCLYAMQTPQAFRVEDIVQAHLLARRQGYVATDDAALLEHVGLPVYLSEGSRENIKLTTPVDLTLADVILQNRLKEAQA